MNNTFKIAIFKDFLIMLAPRSIQNALSIDLDSATICIKDANPCTVASFVPMAIQEIRE